MKLMKKSNKKYLFFGIKLQSHVRIDFQKA